MNTQVTAVEESSEGVASSRPETADQFARRRVRKGKTERDHKTGAWKRRLENLTARGEWANEVRGKHYGNESTVPRMITPHGLGNGAKRFKFKHGRAAKAA